MWILTAWVFWFFSLLKSTICSLKTTIYQFCTKREILYLLLLLFMMKLQFYQLVWAIQLTNVKTYGPNHLSNNLLWIDRHYQQSGIDLYRLLYCSSEHPQCQQELMKEAKQCIPSTQLFFFFALSLVKFM